MGQDFLEPHEITDKATILTCLSLPGLVYDYPEVIAIHQFSQVLLKCYQQNQVTACLRPSIKTTLLTQSILFQAYKNRYT